MAFHDELRAAFAPTPIVAAGAFDQRGGTYPDAEEYSRQIDGKTWEQLDQSYISRRSDALSFLGTDHLLAVLPAYLDLLFILGPRSPIPETLLPLLRKPEGESSKAAKRFHEISEQLSSSQLAMVAAALKRFATDYAAYAEPAQDALDRYWKTFLVEGDRS